MVKRTVPPVLLLLIALAAWSGARAEAPAQVLEALAGFSTDAPPGWAYTLTTRRGGESSSERFDPAAADGRQWQLLQHNGRPASEEEKDRYSRYRVTTNSTATRATFRRGDIDLSTLQPAGSIAGEEEYLCGFRADAPDPLLAHLQLRFRVASHPSRITRYQLHLLKPYSPIFSLQVLRLEVEVTLSPPGPDRPALPASARSFFQGRVLLLKSVVEETEASYSEFEKRVPAAPPERGGT